MWLCSKLDPTTVFGPGNTTHQLGQYVILSLIQQLGVDITKETPLKLNWLREAAMVLNVNDTVIKEHAPVLLNKLKHNLETHYPKYSDPTNPCYTSYKLLMHIVNSLRK